MSEELDNLFCTIADASNYYDEKDYDEKTMTGDRYWKRAIEICDEMYKLANELERMEKQCDLYVEYGGQDNDKWRYTDNQRRNITLPLR